MTPKICEANCGSRLPCVLFSCEEVSPRREFTVAPTSQMWTQWKQRHDSPWSYRLDVIVTFLWYGTISIMWHCDIQSKKVLLTLITFVYFLVTLEHIDTDTPWFLVCRQDGPGPCYQNNATNCRNIEPILLSSSRRYGKWGEHGSVLWF